MANATEEDVLESAGMPVERAVEKREPVYRVYKEGRLPVSKAHGKMWKSRRDHADKQRQQAAGAWDESIRYFNNDQFEPDEPSTRVQAGKRSKRETENIVFSNASTLLPAIYSKNPKIDITVDPSDMPDEGGEPDEEATALNDFARVLQRLVNKLISQQYMNLKPKARRQALFATLTNYGWLKLGWNEKEFSSDDVQQELAELAKQYEEAKDDKAIAEIEGKLLAIEQRFDVVSDSGPFLVVKRPSEILVDPACHDAGDLSTANWVMEDDYLPTNFLRAVYMEKNEGDNSDEYRYLFKPTHVASTDSMNEDDTTGLRFVQWNGDKKEDKDRYEDSYYTKVTYVWDKVTRRVFLYNAEDWKWPLWVWDDPLQLSRFYPYFGLAFAPSTTGVYGKGEVTYYLDQQDAINRINDEAAKIRKWAFSKFMYNKNIIKQTTVEDVLRSDDKAAIGIDIPEGMKMADFWAPVLPPSAVHPELFNKEDKFKAIDRLSAVSDALRGSQFKTNTTNDAVNMYADAAKIRVGEKIDAIEEMLADLGRAIAELCVSKYTKTDVEKILSARDAAHWMEMDVRTFNATLTCSIAAGSTEKPTSANKQQQALQTGQVLGQFAKATPVTLLIVLRMMERAFDNVIVNKDDWDQLKEAIASSIPQQGGQEGQSDPRVQAALQSAIALLPDEVRVQVQQAVSSGTDPAQVLTALAQAKQQSMGQMQ